MIFLFYDARFWVCFLDGACWGMQAHTLSSLDVSFFFQIDFEKKENRMGSWTSLWTLAEKQHKKDQPHTTKKGKIARGHVPGRSLRSQTKETWEGKNMLPAFFSPPGDS